jgi:hypothetical protein
MEKFILGGHSELMEQLEFQYIEWDGFLARYFVKLDGFKKVHHVRFTRDKPGIVQWKQSLQDALRDFNLTKQIISASIYAGMAFENVSAITPEGLSLERQWYLYESNRPHVSQSCRDIACPLPMGEKPISITTYR